MPEYFEFMRAWPIYPEDVDATQRILAALQIKPPQVHENPRLDINTPRWEQELCIVARDEEAKPGHAADIRQEILYLSRNALRVHTNSPIDMAFVDRATDDHLIDDTKRIIGSLTVLHKGSVWFIRSTQENRTSNSFLLFFDYRTAEDYDSASPMHRLAVVSVKLLIPRRDFASPRALSILEFDHHVSEVLAKRDSLSIPANNDPTFLNRVVEEVFKSANAPYLEKAARVWKPVRELLAPRPAA